LSSTITTKYIISLKIFAIAAIAAVASADKAPAPSYGYKPVPAPAPAYPAPAPAYHPAPAPAPAYHPAPAPAYKPHPAPAYKAAPEPFEAPKYSYTYGVADSAYGNKLDFGHTESRDGYATKGSYRVALPDGRVQVVTYHADENGYVADVSYEGVAVYPEYKPTYHAAPAPAYAPAPAPAYKPAPAPAYKPAPVAPVAPAAEE
jgi:hypothetical protein